MPTSKYQRWLLAIRPKTLYAAIAPVFIGTALAVHVGKFRFWPAFAALLGAIFIQIGTNLANDAADFYKGADTSERLGPVRVTQAGLLTSRQVTIGMWVTFGFAALAGIYLIIVAGWPVLVIGLLSIAAGIAYTAGPIPLGYHGLGDLAVFIFFGLVAVLGTYYVQAEEITVQSILVALPPGLLATAILVINNLRDLPTDQKAGKRTLAVRIGRQGTQIEYLGLLVVSYLIPLLMWMFNQAPPGVILTWVSLPLAYQLSLGALKETGKALNPILAKTGLLELLYCILFSIGLLL